MPHRSQQLMRGDADCERIMRLAASISNHIDALESILRAGLAGLNSRLDRTEELVTRLEKSVVS
jgi:hypothetical protein